jgi:hypothetical protein
MFPKILLLIKTTLEFYGIRYVPIVIYVEEENVPSSIAVM